MKETAEKWKEVDAHRLAELSHPTALTSWHNDLVDYCSNQMTGKATSSYSAKYLTGKSQL